MFTVQLKVWPPAVRGPWLDRSPVGHSKKDTDRAWQIRYRNQLLQRLLNCVGDWPGLHIISSRAAHSLKTADGGNPPGLRFWFTDAWKRIPWICRQLFHPPATTIRPLVLVRWLTTHRVRQYSLRLWRDGFKHRVSARKPGGSVSIPRPDRLQSSGNAPFQSVFFQQMIRLAAVLRC
jgi:hypothetical protein